MNTFSTTGLATLVSATLVAAIAGIPTGAHAVAPEPASDHAAATAAQAAARPVSKRNTIKRAGQAPHWIQSPYLRKIGKKRFAVSAKLYVEPLHDAASRKRYGKKLRQDVVHFRVSVAKKGVSTPKRPRPINLLPQSALAASTDKTVKVTDRGVIAVQQKLGKKVSRQLRKASFKQRKVAVAVSASHWKDTFRRSPVWALKQVTAGDLAPRKDSKRSRKHRLRSAQATHRAIIAKKARAQSGDVRAAWAGASPTYNHVYVENSTPFDQTLNWNPNIQCMWTGGDVNDASDAVQEPVTSGTTVMFQYLGESSQSQWPGLNGATKGMNAPGTGVSWTTDLVGAATDAGESLLDSMTEKETYSEAGAAAAVGGAAIKFLVALIKGMPGSTCDDVADYPELFGLSTTVTDVGYAGTWVNQWNRTWLGQEVGNAGSSVAPNASFTEDYLTPMVGAQTNFTYYWNGGQPAPMVSNNAASGAFTGGGGSVQGGLMQVVAPNPGQPASWSGIGGNPCEQSQTSWEECNYGAEVRQGTQREGMTINLVYLTNPEFTAGLQSVGGSPEMTVSEDSNGDYLLSCDLSDLDASLSLPFGKAGATTIGSASMATQPTNPSGTKPQDANWLVNFFGVDDDGNYVYSYNKVVNGINTHAVSANAQQQEVSIAAAAASGSQTKATGLVTPADMAKMETADGQPGTPTSFGCNATPTITLNGMQIDAPDGTAVANAWGNNWPMPTTSGQGWPANFWGGNYTYQTNWSWQTPVNQLNMTYQGLPVSSLSNDDEGTPPNPPLSVAADPGDTEATVSWKPPSTTGSAPVTGYTATSSPGGLTCSALAPDTSCSIPGLTNGTAYTFTVVAYTQAGSSSPSLPSAKVAPGKTPGPPSNVTATAGTLSATVDWDAPTFPGSTGISGYTVTASPGGRTCSAIVPATKCKVAKLSPGTSYTFTVEAENTYGLGQSSSPSNAVVPLASN